MENIASFFEKLYNDFNDRRIDTVISNMTENVKWANGMEGGWVYGHDGVREYWTRQFAMVHSTVTPVKITQENDIVKIQVHQVVHDMNKNLLADEAVEHVFTMDGNKIAEFNIGEKTKTNG